MHPECRWMCLVEHRHRWCHCCGCASIARTIRSMPKIWFCQEAAFITADRRNTVQCSLEDIWRIIGAESHSDADAPGPAVKYTTDNQYNPDRLHTTWLHSIANVCDWSAALYWDPPRKHILRSTDLELAGRALCNNGHVPT